MPERPANLRPGALPDVRVGDRWLIRFRGGRRLLACRVLDKRARGYWRVVLEDGLGRVELPHHSFVERLPAADLHPVPGEIERELRRIRGEVARLHEKLDALGSGG